MITTTNSHLSYLISERCSRHLTNPDLELACDFIESHPDVDLTNTNVINYIAELLTSTSKLYTILFTLFFLITMRKVEMQMNTAIRNRVNWSGGNTTVMIDPEQCGSKQLYSYTVT